MTSLLSRIDRPQDLHALSEDELQAVAQEVRELLIDTVGEIGGHFGANLGTCEIAVAVHSLIDSPRDKVLWDVGHQAYPHKVLTGPPRRARRRSASTAASRRSARSPSPSTTSWAPATPRRRSATPSASRRRCCASGAEDGKVVAVIGDGAMTGGVAFEAVSQAGGLGTPIVVILNDNGMSIAPERRRAVALHEPRPAGPGPVGGARGRRGEAHEAAGGHRRGVRAPRPALQGVREGVLGSRACGGRSSTGPTSA